MGNLVTRSREMAVRKCYGAEPKNIHAIVFSEALVHVGLSIVLAAILVFLSKGTVENFLSAPVSVLVLNRGCWILVAICLLVLLVGGWMPGWLYCKIPVAIAFRQLAFSLRFPAFSWMRLCMWASSSSGMKGFLI